MITSSFGPTTTIGTQVAHSDSKLTHRRQQLRNVLEAVARFRDISPTMPAGTIQMFLTVALNEGASLTELAELTDMKKSTASRYLLDLSDKTRSGSAGYGLITREVDPNELRRNMYALSASGRHMVHTITEGD